MSVGFTKRTVSLPGARTNQATTCGFVSVGTGSATILNANASRLEVTLVNDSVNSIYVFLNTTDGTTVPTAVVGSGIRLNANGGSWSSEHYNGPIAAIAAGAGSNLTVVEI